MLGSMVRGEVVLGVVGVLTIEIRSSSFRCLLLMVGVGVVCLVTSVLFVLVLLLAL